MIKDSIDQQLSQAVACLQIGGIVAYPTEAVYGLGCDPFNQKAIEKLFHVKQRPMEKGVILVAASVGQIKDWVELEGTVWQDKVLASWPGPVTWVLPLKKPMPDWVTGGRDTVAIRVSDHPVVQRLCEAFGKPIVSTSANLTGFEPARSCDEVQDYFANQVYCVDAPLGKLSQPTQIWDARTLTRLR